ncbi:MAG: general secretion pathway protein G [Verrucomicrobiales bacterium]|jgi:general secretion pathway protein G
MKTNLFHFTRRRSHGAFTLIELVLVLTIISVLVGTAIYLLRGTDDVAKEMRVESDVKMITTQLKLYEARNFQPPTTDQGLMALVSLPDKEPVPERWTQLLEEVPKDSWNRLYQYKYPAVRSSQKYDIYSHGADGVESDDDLGNWKNASQAVEE